ncbi:methyltransferase type 11 [Treponema primitia ZAS-2]|uniref:Methyltransferase type 11 n=1 Tax=Treponema primitia (strain ATCC BAA-887 / DSM 12427 / ZAS-2) TaxID=545694 RepID=F5YHE1_TREPZ|nr:methyltransferase domain-containing protein [Treponema primitia]AEF85466.1 methyltransferase type 11 [Treponema primitia ZAS-2]
MPEWFEDGHFWEHYGPIMFDRKRWDEVPLVADGLTRMARLDLYHRDTTGSSNTEQGPRVLDLCCGFGRIALELARRGFSVTGVDITETYLNTGREDASYEKLDVEFVKGDVRDFKRSGFFDLALNLYISFGYFENPADDLLFARNACEALKPGGSFIIETLGKEIAVRDFVEAEWFERAGYTVLTEYAPADSWAGLKNRWILIKGGERIEKVFTQRLYAGSEIRRLLFDAGFSSVELYGSWDEAPYDHRAEVLIAVGRK